MSFEHPDGTFVLHDLVLCQENKSEKRELYQKIDRFPAYRPFHETGVSMIGGECLDLVTYYNSFSAGRWRRLAGLTSVLLILRGSGRVRVRLCGFSTTGKLHTEIPHIVSLDDNPRIICPAAEEPDIELWGVEIDALDEYVLLVGGSWSTLQPPRRKVCLAAVITTFNRVPEARRALTKFTDLIIPHLGETFSRLYLVDNGKSLDIASTDKVQVIPNENLGGSGGFTRGLMEVMKAGEATHTLFMDDDADCEPSAISRTIALLSYAQNERAAVAGAMMFDHAPTIQFERSAIFHRSGQSRELMTACGTHLNMASRQDIIRNCTVEDGNYGGWWFFAFPMTAAKHLPFPYFVRCDDVDFPVVNEIPVQTLNGISTHCEDLGSKTNTTVAYLEARNRLTLSFIHAEIPGVELAFQTAVLNAVSAGKSFDYPLMEATIAGLEHAMHGPDFFIENFSAVPHIKDLAQRDSKELAEAGKLRLRPAKYISNIGRKIRNVLTDSGNRIGGFLESKAIPVVGHRNQLRNADVAKYAAVGFYQDGNLYLLRKDPSRLRAARRRLDAAVKQFAAKRSDLMQVYRQRHIEVRSPAMWQAAFGLRDDTPTL